MNDMERARAMFPLMPDEVFDAWLAPLIMAEGWPFTTKGKYDVLGNWPRYLLKIPPAKWASFTWSQSSLYQIHQHLALESIADVMDVVMNSIKGAAGAAFPVGDSQNRVIAARENIAKLQHFPGFVTAFADPTGKLRVLDGHHRLAAWYRTADSASWQVPVWIARAR